MKSRGENKRGKKSTKSKAHFLKKSVKCIKFSNQVKQDKKEHKLLISEMKEEP